MLTLFANAVTFTASSQRVDFLKSRPQFNDSYFDGQRDPAEGWMKAWNAWRYPAFYIGPKYSMNEFTFKPPHTLFIDAALQAQDNADLITSGDRTDFDYIIDAVTHQPIGGRQAAIKGSDGVFYWDLSSRTKAEGTSRNNTRLATRHVTDPFHVCIPKPAALGLVEGTAENTHNLRNRYKEWHHGMASETAPEANRRIIKAKRQGKFLVGVTRPQNAKQWEKFVTAYLKKEQVKEKEKESGLLSVGEVRVELMSFKLSRNGACRSRLNAAACTTFDYVLVLLAPQG
jgi:hypothetical protein